MIKNYKEYKEFIDLVNEEISLGHVDPYDIKKRFYKSGDYICSSFQIDDREVVVTSVMISSDEIKQDPPTKWYKTLNNYLSQFGIDPKEYVNIGFGEYKKVDNKIIPFEDNNVNDISTLFRKMSTIIKLSLELIEYHKSEFAIIKSIPNDSQSGIEREYNKRDKFYQIFLNDFNHWFIKGNYQIHGEPINNFFVIQNRNK
jgi:hypothetical protein